MDTLPTPTGPFPKRLIVCCDGTWNTPAQTDRGRLAPTNVVRLARALDDDFDRPGPLQAPADGYRQKVFYDQGVGTGNFAAPVVRNFPFAPLRASIRNVYLWAQNKDLQEGFRILPLLPRWLMHSCVRVDSWVGGATGTGLVENVYNAYQFLADNYNEGDEIYLFGFSRGAYTVRSLAGMIYKCGLLKREPCLRLHPINVRDQKPHRELTCQESCLPLCANCQLNRSRIEDIHTAFQAHKDEKRVARKQAAQQPAQGPTAGPDAAVTAAKQTLDDIKEKYTAQVKIKMVGVWDTVGAMGIPDLFSLLPGTAARRNRYSFLDTSINEDVQYAYHALALDERRILFKPAIWTARPPGRSVDANGEPTLRQVWFAGVHSNVGGGYDDAGLADISLGWMMRWAEKRGLRFQQTYQKRLFPDHFGELRDSIDTFIGKAMYRAETRFPKLSPPGYTYPDGQPLVHYSVFDKHRRGMMTYAPPLPLNWCEGLDYHLCQDPI